MTGHLHVVFAPLVPLVAIEAFGLLSFLVSLFAFHRRVRGALLRALLFALVLLALSDPSVIEEQREPLKDTALLVIDDSASMNVGDRRSQAEKAADAITTKLAQFPDLDVDVLHVKGGNETDLFQTLMPKLASVPHDRLAGVIAITDGEIHDTPQAPLTGPFHALIAGHHNEVDRRLVIKEAPAYGIVGKKITFILRVEDYPKAQSELAHVTLTRDDGTTEVETLAVGKDMSVDVPISHAGPNLFAFQADAVPHELTAINNNAAISVNGIRDRLRVLLISGEPHIGGRTWRNFLKADPAVDLIHFTILRSPMKASFVPNDELALIAFPVHELFDVKLKSFDLVIFDRFSNRSLMPDEYLANIAKYVEDGGALLVSSATGDNASNLDVSTLSRVLPSSPDGHIMTGEFVPDLTSAGKRHPVTATLAADMPREKWGGWFRQAGSQATKGDVLMSGLNGAPLLVLQHAGKGRVAEFLSDQFWLWSRGFEGGGPEAELLRRVAHWLVQEPDLDETALRAHGEMDDEGHWQLVALKQSLHDASDDVTVTDPDGVSVALTLGSDEKGQAGVLKAALPVTKTGLYHVKDKDQEILAMIGPLDAPEFGEMVATEDRLAPVLKATSGAAFWLDDYAEGPQIKRVSAGGAQSGRNWIGLKKNEQFRVTGSKAWPLWPAWLAIALLLLLMMFTWRREGSS